MKQALPSPLELYLYPQTMAAVPDGGSHSRNSLFDRTWLGFLPPRVRTKTCPLFQSPVGAARIPRDCQREIVVRDRRPCRIWLEFLPPRVRTKTCPLFHSAVGAAPIP